MADLILRDTDREELIKDTAAAVPRPLRASGLVCGMTINKSWRGQ